MADLSSQKFPQFSPDGTIYPDLVRESPWGRLEPLVTAQQVRDRHLFGLPLVSFFPDPGTHLVQRVTDAQLDTWVDQQVVLLEELSGCTVAPSEVDAGYPFDRVEYQSYGYMQLPKRPVSSLLSLQVAAANFATVFDVPLDWISTPYLVRGQLNIQPMGVLAAPLALAPNAQPFLLYTMRLQFIPAFWRVRYVAGFRDMMLPKFVNWLIGVMTAIEVLRQLQATYAWGQSGSLGIDGLSQSSSGPGPQAYGARIQAMEAERDTLIRKFKKFCGLALLSSTI